MAVDVPECKARSDSFKHIFALGPFFKSVYKCGPGVCFLKEVGFGACPSV